MMKQFVIHMLITIYMLMTSCRLTCIVPSMIHNISRHIGTKEEKFQLANTMQMRACGDHLKQIPSHHEPLEIVQDKEATRSCMMN
jgi:hypothetical protein